MTALEVLFTQYYVFGVAHQTEGVNYIRFLIEANKCFPQRKCLLLTCFQGSCTVFLTCWQYIFPYKNIKHFCLLYKFFPQEMSAEMFILAVLAPIRQNGNTQQRNRSLNSECCLCLKCAIHTPWGQWQEHTTGVGPNTKKLHLNKQKTMGILNNLQNTCEELERVMSQRLQFPITTVTPSYKNSWTTC